MPADIKPTIAPQNKDALSVTAALGTLAAVLAAAGVAAGTVGKVISEEPLWFAIALIAVVVSAFLGFTAGYLKGHRSRERQLLFGANVVLLGGLIAGLIGAVTVWSNTRPPMVTASPEHSKAGTFLNVTVKDSGLDAHEIIRVVVERMRRLPGHSQLSADDPIYVSVAGSDPDGKVDQTIKVPLPAGVSGLVRARAYLGNHARSCGDKQNTSGCATISVLRAAEAPQLNVQWRARRTLAVTVVAHDVPARRMALRVFGLTGPGKKRRPVELAVWSLSPDAAGDFRRQIAIRYGRRYHSLCAVASTRGAAATRRCPPRSSNERDAWLRYRVPSG